MVCRSVSQEEKVKALLEVVGLVCSSPLSESVFHLSKVTMLLDGVDAEGLHILRNSVAALWNVLDGRVRKGGAK